MKFADVGLSDGFFDSAKRVLKNTKELTKNVTDVTISEFLTKIQASIARQEESIEALKICLKDL
jgi:hypothetical protein